MRPQSFPACLRLLSSIQALISAIGIDDLNILFFSFFFFGRGYFSGLFARVPLPIAFRFELIADKTSKMSAKIAFVFAIDDHPESSGSISLTVAESASRLETNEERAPHDRVSPMSLNSRPVFLSKSYSIAP